MKKLLVALLLGGLGLVAHAADKVYVIGMSQCNLGEPWRVQMNTDVKNAAEKHSNIKMIFKDAQNDSLKQRAQVEEFVASKVDLIIISPKESAPLTPPVAEAYKKGIPVIVLDRKLLGSDFTSYIGADNKKIGRAAGKWVVQKLGGKGNVVELKGLMTSSPGQDRNSGFREGIKGSDFKVVFEADMKWLEPNARKEMESALATNPEDRPGLRPQRSGRSRRLPGRQGRRAREGDAVHRHRRPSTRGPGLREAGDPWGELRVPDRRPRGDRDGARHLRGQAGPEGRHPRVARLHQGQRGQRRRVAEVDAQREA